MNRITVVLAPLIAAACVTAPPHGVAMRAPPERWIESTDGVSTAEVDDRWWRGFNDALLDRVVAAAVDGDDVALAEARLAEASARMRGARAELAPALSAEARASESRAGDDLPETDFSQAAAALLWSPDLFGADRARSRAALARRDAAGARLAEARRQARLAAAHLYITIRDAENRHAMAQRTVASLEETLRLAEARNAAGLVSELDVAQARAAFGLARAAPPALARTRTSARLALEALIGTPAGALEADLGAGDIPQAGIASAVLAPAEVLARRPDLIAAEAALSAAGYDARAARADFWPRLSLGALIGVQSASPATPLAGDGEASQSVISLALPVLTFGRLESARAASDARLRAAAIAYRQAATLAVSEVERAFAAGADAEARGGALIEAVSAARTQAELARARYVAGLSPLLEVLSAERAVFEAEAALAGARADAAHAYADLNAAMGLGALAPTPQ